MNRAIETLGPRITAALRTIGILGTRPCRLPTDPYSVSAENNFSI